MFDPFEYLVARHRDGLLKTDFTRPLGKVSYHVPCHGRVQKIGRKTEEMFRLIGKTVTVELTTVERCSGHAGTYGVKTETHPLALKIGKPVFKAMAASTPDFISSDCALAGHHIAQGMANDGVPAARAAAPAQPVCARRTDWNSRWRSPASSLLTPRGLREGAQGQTRPRSSPTASCARCASAST